MKNVRDKESKYPLGLILAIREVIEGLKKAETLISQEAPVEDVLEQLGTQRTAAGLVESWRKRNAKKWLREYIDKKMQ